MSKIRLQDIKQLMYAEYGDSEEDVTHPMTQVGIVLLSAAVLDTTEAAALRKFTMCSRDVISAITFNMQNNGLWTNRGYDCSSWFNCGVIMSGEEFWNHIGAACGELWFPGADRNLAIDTCNLI